MHVSSITWDQFVLAMKAEYDIDVFCPCGIKPQMIETGKHTVMVCDYTELPDYEVDYMVGVYAHPSGELLLRINIVDPVDGGDRQCGDCGCVHSGVNPYRGRWGQSWRTRYRKDD
jgi:hypothetical protein